MKDSGICLHSPRLERKRCVELYLALDGEVVEDGESIKCTLQISCAVLGFALIERGRNIPVTASRTSHEKAACPEAASSFSKVKASL